MSPLPACAQMLKPETNTDCNRMQKLIPPLMERILSMCDITARIYMSQVNPEIRSVLLETHTRKPKTWLREEGLNKVKEIIYVKYAVTVFVSRKRKRTDLN
jgi:hypothetical protein